MMNELIAAMSGGGGKPQIEMGTVGWEDTELFYEKGTDENDGHTLVRVQLFRGRDITKPIKKGIAQGHKMLCNISGGLFRIPPKGTRVYVAVPTGYENSPGAGVIFATVEKSPTVQFEQDRVVLNFGEDCHVMIKAKSITMSDFASRFIAVGTPRSAGVPGVMMHDETGSGICVQSGTVGAWSADGGAMKVVMQLSPTKGEIYNSAGSFVRLDGNKFSCFGSTCQVVGGGVYLGKAATALNMALWGPTGIAGVASPSVFISPI